MATDFNYANTITAATPAVAAEVQDNFDDVLTWVKAYYQQTLDTTTEIAAAIAAIPDDPEEAGQEFVVDWVAPGLGSPGTYITPTSTPTNVGWNYEFQIPAGDDRTWTMGIQYSIQCYISGGTPATNNTLNARVLVDGTSPLFGGYASPFGGALGEWGVLSGGWSSQETGAGTGFTIEVEVFDNFNTGFYRCGQNGSWVRVFAYPQHSLVGGATAPIITYTP